MRHFSEIGEANDAAQDFYYASRANLPVHVEEKLAPLFRTGASPVDAIVNTAEIIFAAAGELPKEARELASALSDFRQTKGYHTDPHEPKRAGKLAAALARTGAWARKDGDPAPLERFLPPPAAAEA